jgi:urease accessory protein
VSTSTSTPERLGADQIVVRAEAIGGRTVVAEMAGVQPWHPRVLARRGAGAAVALVATRATLIAGDAIHLSVTVGPGAALEIVEVGATVAHHARGGPQARITVRLVVAPGGALVWCGRPLIAAAGCRACRDTVAEVGAGGRLLLGDAVALGRARERPGELVARTRITCDGVPLLEETLDTRDLETLSSPVVLAGRRILRSLTLAGIVDDDPPAGSMLAAGPGVLWRSLRDEESPTAEIAGRWRSLVLADASR